MVFNFTKWLKKKREKEAGITEEDKRYVYSHPPPKRPSEIMAEERAREEYIQSVTETQQFSDYCQNIETFRDRQTKRKKSIWDELMR